VDQSIYFDESGFTGNNLLCKNQPIFVYGSVATDEDESQGLITYLRDKYHIQSPELKGRLLVRYAGGRAAISELLNYYGDRKRVLIADKKYALGCKFFEYIFEPCISKRSSLFYSIGFHKFISTFLYVSFVAGQATAEQLFADFESVMRIPSAEALGAALGASTHSGADETMSQIVSFANDNLATIREEIIALPGEGVDKWTLDVTSSALHSLLASWGVRYDSITAICDHSGPLQQHRGIFDSMIGRTDRAFTRIFGDTRPLTYNLTGPVRLENSAQYYGIQISDAIAAAAVYAWSTGTDAIAEEWRAILTPVTDPASLIADPSHLDPSMAGVQINVLVLGELCARARDGRPLLDGFGDFVQIATEIVGPGGDPRLR
jgi:hypothetical protein